MTQHETSAVLLCIIVEWKRNTRKNWMGRQGRSQKMETKTEITDRIVLFISYSLHLSFFRKLPWSRRFEGEYLTILGDCDLLSYVLIHTILTHMNYRLFLYETCYLLQVSYNPWLKIHERKRSLHYANYNFQLYLCICVSNFLNVLKKRNKSLVILTMISLSKSVSSQSSDTESVASVMPISPIPSCITRNNEPDQGGERPNRSQDRTNIRPKTFPTSVPNQVLSIAQLFCLHFYFVLVAFCTSICWFCCCAFFLLFSCPSF